MRFMKKKDDASTVRKVWNDDKTTCFGVVGTVKDLLSIGLFDYCTADKRLWAFVPRTDVQNAQFGDSREAACRSLEE